MLVAAYRNIEALKCGVWEGGGQLPWDLGLLVIVVNKKNIEEAMSFSSPFGSLEGGFFALPYGAPLFWQVCMLPGPW